MSTPMSEERLAEIKQWLIDQIGEDRPDEEIRMSGDLFVKELLTEVTRLRALLAPIPDEATNLLSDAAVILQCVWDARARIGTWSREKETLDAIKEFLKTERTPVGSGRIGSEPSQAGSAPSAPIPDEELQGMLAIREAATKVTLKVATWTAQDSVSTAIVAVLPDGDDYILAEIIAEDQQGVADAKAIVSAYEALPRVVRELMRYRVAHQEGERHEG